MRQSRQQLSVSPTTTASSVYSRSSSNSNSSTPLLGQEEGITVQTSTTTTTTTPDSTTSTTMLSRSFSTSNSEEEEEASSGKENNCVVDTPSAWKELHSEVRRINARADELMDSFRRMANEEPSSNRSSSMDSNTPERPIRGDFFVDTFDDNNDNEDEDPHNPVLSCRSRRSTPSSSSSPSADVGDDSMNDELDRLEEATAVIRESLDRSDGLTESQLHALLWSPNNNNDMTSPSPSMSTHSHSSSRNQQQQPTPPLFSSSERASPHILATTTLFSTSSDCGSPNQTMSTHESTLKPTTTTTTTTTNTLSSSLLSSSPPSSFSTPPDQLVEPGHGMEALLLAVTVVWAAIVVALVQARYCLLDEDGFLFTVT